MNNRCILLDNMHNITIAQRALPTLAPNEVLIRIRANGLCGSDVHFYADGRLGNFVVTRPYSPGHEASGEIVAVGDDVRNFAIGERVVPEPGIPCGRCEMCRTGRYNLCPDVKFLSAPPIDGTMADYLPIRADSVHKVPKNMHFEDAAMVEPAAVAVHAVNRAGNVAGASCVIFGMGTIGLMTLQAFKAAGGGLAICVDPLELKLDFARKLGADECLKPTEIQANLAQIAFETAGSAAATRELFRAVQPGGIVVQVGWPGGNIVSMDIAAFLEKELLYTSVNRYANAFPIAISHIASGKIQTAPLITHRFAFDDAAHAFKFTHERPNEVIKTIIMNE